MRSAAGPGPPVGHSEESSRARVGAVTGGRQNGWQDISAGIRAVVTHGRAGAVRLSLGTAVLGCAERDTAARRSRVSLGRAELRRHEVSTCAASMWSLGSHSAWGSNFASRTCAAVLSGVIRCATCDSNRISTRQTLSRLPEARSTNHILATFLVPIATCAACSSRKATWLYRRARNVDLDAENLPC